MYGDKVTSKQQFIMAARQAATRGHRAVSRYLRNHWRQCAETTALGVATAFVANVTGELTNTLGMGGLPGAAFATFLLAGGRMMWKGCMSLQEENPLSNFIRREHGYSKSSISDLVGGLTNLGGGLILFFGGSLFVVPQLEEKQMGEIRQAQMISSQDAAFKLSRSLPTGIKTAGACMDFFHTPFSWNTDPGTACFNLVAKGSATKEGCFEATTEMELKSRMMVRQTQNLGSVRYCPDRLPVAARPPGFEKAMSFDDGNGLQKGPQ